MGPGLRRDDSFLLFKFNLLWRCVNLLGVCRVTTVGRAARLRETPLGCQRVEMCERGGPEGEGARWAEGAAASNVLEESAAPAIGIIHHCHPGANGPLTPAPLNTLAELERQPAPLISTRVVWVSAFAETTAFYAY
jgi:hypothetical protein